MRTRRSPFHSFKKCNRDGAAAVGGLRHGNAVLSLGGTIRERVPFNSDFRPRNLDCAVSCIMSEFFAGQSLKPVFLREMDHFRCSADWREHKTLCHR
jgi:hypothetical protein